MSDIFDEQGFGDITKLLAELPDLDTGSGEHVIQRLRRIGSFGALEALTGFVAACQERHHPRATRPRLCLFSASHGLHARDHADFAEAALAALQPLTDGKGPLHRLCEGADAELRAYDLSLEVASADPTLGPALQVGEAARAMTYGMIAVEQGLDILMVAGASVGSRATVALLSALLTGEKPADWGAPDDLASDLALAASRHVGAAANPLEALVAAGSLEIAAIAGTILAARFARIPVIVEGAEAMTAVGLIGQLEPRATAHVLLAAPPSGRSLAESRWQDRLKLKTVMNEAIDAPFGTAGLMALYRLKPVLALVGGGDHAPQGTGQA